MHLGHDHRSQDRFGTFKVDSGAGGKVLVVEGEKSRVVEGKLL